MAALICGVRNRQIHILELLENANINAHSFGSVEEFVSGPDPNSFDCVIIDHSDVCNAVDSLAVIGSTKIPTFVVCESPTITAAVESFRNGAFHFLGAMNGPELVNAVHEGFRLMDSERQTANAVHRFREFNEDEHRVIRLIIEGTNNRDIAQKLGLGVRTIERIRSRILLKSGATSLPNAVQLYTIAFGSHQNPGSQEAVTNQ
jgi:FixJ family two-component response regulator